MNLARFPRVRLGHFPTPLERLERLSAALGGPDIYVKRDDCTGLATGGNKTRKLEFLMADALAKGADTVITHGAIQSNHARQTAAAAGRLGLKCRILLEDRIDSDDRDYRQSGNAFLDRLCGAPTRVYARGADMTAAMDAAASEVRAKGGKPYVIPGGGSCPVGELGYVGCALEILQQAHDRGLRVDCVVHATGSAGTQAGLLAGFEGCRSGVPVYGISVRAARQAQEESVFKHAAATADYLGMPGAVARERVVANSDYVGAGYGRPTAGMVEAVTMLARIEGLLLDPVYTGKAMAGLIDLARQGHFKAGQNVVFVHTGGSAALFAYLGAFAAAIEPFAAPN